MNAIKNLSIGFKVALAPSIAIACLCALSAVAWLANAELSRAINVVTQEILPHQNKLAELKLKAMALSSLINQSLAWEGAGFKEAQIKTLDDEIVKNSMNLAQEFKRLSDDGGSTPAKKQVYIDLSTEFTKFNKVLADVLELKSGTLALASGYMSTLDASFARMTQLFVSLNKIQDQEADEISITAQKISSNNATTIVAVLIIASIICAAFTVIAARLIVTPLQEAVELAQTMAAGDFTRTSDSAIYQDATGRVLSAMNEVSRKLGETVRNIRNSADEVDTASREIAQGNADLSSRTESTAASLEETSAALKELSAQVKESADFAHQANQLARDASVVADEGGKVVLETVDVMEKINSQAKKISEIIGVIDGIAFQTNILALNAAVEAARAGEQGRGFAVVAQEVRTLAQRSAEAAKEIRGLIGASVTQAGIGAEKVRLAGNTMQRVVTAIRNVGISVDEISRTSASQADGFSQVETAVTEMDNHTQQNAALVEQASAAAMSLQMQAQKLLETVDLLKTRKQENMELLY